MQTGSRSLGGKVAVVTGASRGIGKALAAPVGCEADVCRPARTTGDI